MWLFIPFLLAAAIPSTPSESKLLGHELTMLEDLIHMTEESLVNQKHLREMVLEYKKDLENYLKNSSDKETVMKAAKTAHRVLEEVKQHHLIEAFEPDFISELTLFSQIAQKRGIPKP